MPKQSATTSKSSSKANKRGSVYRSDGLYRAFHIAVSNEKLVTSGLYLGALSRLPNHSESDFTRQFRELYWRPYINKFPDRVRMLRQDAADSRFAVGTVLRRFNNDLTFSDINNRNHNCNVVYPVTRTGYQDLCSRRHLTTEEVCEYRISGIECDTTGGTQPSLANDNGNGLVTRKRKRDSDEHVDDDNEAESSKKSGGVPVSRTRKSRSDDHINAEVEGALADNANDKDDDARDQVDCGTTDPVNNPASYKSLGDVHIKTTDKNTHLTNVGHTDTAPQINNPVGRSIFGDGHIDTTAYFTNPISGSHTDTAPQINNPINNPISHQVSNTISDSMIDPQLTNPVDHHIETAYPIDNPINNPISHQVSNTISDGMVDPKLINPVDHHIETAYPIDNPIGQDHIETAPLNIDPVTDGVSDMDVDDKAAQLEADITGYSYFGIEDDDTASHTIGRFSESRTGVEVDDESLEKNETLTAPQDIYHRVDGLLEVDVDTAPAQYPSSPSSYYTANDGSDDEVAA